MLVSPTRPLVNLSQVELMCSISDMTKLDALGMPLVWHVLACCVGLASLLLSCLVSADMYFTAKYFHHPQASGGAAAVKILSPSSGKRGCSCCMECVSRLT